MNIWLGLRLATKNVSWQTDGGEAEDCMSLASLDLTNAFKKIINFCKFNDESTPAAWAEEEGLTCSEHVWPSRQRTALTQVLFESFYFTEEDSEAQKHGITTQVREPANWQSPEYPRKSV